jgi:GGDEF domain-containing protein
MQIFEFTTAIIAAAVTLYAFSIIRQVTATGSDSIWGFKLLACKAIIAVSLAGLASYLYAISSNSNFKHVLSASIVLTVSILAFTVTLLLKRNASLLRSLKENLLVQSHAVKADAEAVDETTGSPETDIPAVLGLLSKHELNHKLDEEMVRAIRQRVPLYFAILSIDNDEMPDNALAVAGHVITNNIRAKIDTGFISTDREFAIILPFTVKKHAVNIVKRVLTGLNAWDIDASIGLVSCNDVGASNAVEVIKVAELATSEAKAEGGNRIRLLRRNSDRKTEYVQPRSGKSRHLKLLK